jgi:NAD-dependent histone deacetylase SIR2
VLTFIRHRCIDCKSSYPVERMNEAIHSKQVPRCLDTTCNGLVKPDIVFFGEQLPESFFENRSVLAEADLCIVMGTSLSVAPFSSLPQLCADECPRLLINSEQVGDLGRWPDDVLLLEDCDGGVRKLAKACGWLEELVALWASTAREGEHPETKEEVVKKSEDELLDDKINKLTKEIEESLRLSKAQQEWLDNHVDNKLARKQEDEEIRAKPHQATSTGETHIEERFPVLPTDDTESRTLAPVSNPGATKTDPGGGLEHVFPHMKKPSL